MPARDGFLESTWMTVQPAGLFAGIRVADITEQRRSGALVALERGNLKLSADRSGTIPPMERDMAMNVRRALIESVAVLAAPANAQIAWLTSIGTGPLADELGLEFDSWYRLLPELESLHVVSSVATQLSKAVSDALEEVPQSKWTETALTFDPAWERVRRSAGLALVALLESSPEPRSVYVRTAS